MLDALRNRLAGRWTVGDQARIRGRLLPETVLGVDRDHGTITTVSGTHDMADCEST